MQFTFKRMSFEIKSNCNITMPLNKNREDSAVIYEQLLTGELNDYYINWTETPPTLDTLIIKFKRSLTTWDQSVLNAIKINLPWIWHQTSVHEVEPGVLPQQCWKMKCFHTLLWKSSNFKMSHLDNFEWGDLFCQSACTAPFHEQINLYCHTLAVTIVPQRCCSTSSFTHLQSLVIMHIFSPAPLTCYSLGLKICWPFIYAKVWAWAFTKTVVEWPELSRILVIWRSVTSWHPSVKADFLV